MRSNVIVALMRKLIGVVRLMSVHLRRRSMRRALDSVLSSSDTCTVLDIGSDDYGDDSLIARYVEMTNACVLSMDAHDEIVDYEGEGRSTSKFEKVQIVQPFLVGNGEVKSFYRYNDPKLDSSFELDFDLCSRYEHISDITTVGVESLPSVRLDDVGGKSPISLLKIDIQGGELDALKGGEDVLKRTSAIICEVEFREIYKDQPLFGDVASFLSEQGFTFIDFIFLQRYRFVGQAQEHSRDVLLWADALFLRCPCDHRQIKDQIQVAVSLGKYGLARRLIDSSRETEGHESIIAI